MVNFAIIAEGPTDIPVIQNILCGYFKADIDLNPQITAIGLRSFAIAALRLLVAHLPTTITSSST
jgi:hypothetical protein